MQPAYCVRFRNMIYCILHNDKDFPCHMGSRKETNDTETLRRELLDEAYAAHEFRNRYARPRASKESMDILSDCDIMSYRNKA